MNLCESHSTFWKLEAILKRSDVAPGAANCTARSPGIQATGAFGVRTPRHPETTETTESKILYEIVVYGNLWSMAVYDVYGRSKDSSHILLQISTFCIFSTFSTCLGLPSPILRFDFGIFGYQVNLCPFCARRTLFDCVFFSDSRVFRAWVKEQRKQVYRCLQMFTVYSMSIFWCEWHVRLRIP